LFFLQANIALRFQRLPASEDHRAGREKKSIGPLKTERSDAFLISGIKTARVLMQSLPNPRGYKTI
jgi:hypothetical protein